MDYSNVPIVEVSEPPVRMCYSKYNPLDHRHPDEIAQEQKDRNVIQSRLYQYPKIVVISATGILGDVMRLCQSVNHALFHLWYEDLAMHSTDIFSYNNSALPLNAAAFLRSISGNGFLLRESFARYVGQKMINACCFSFEGIEEGEEVEKGEFPYSIINAFERSSFKLANITCSLHESKKGELFRVDVIDFDGRIDTTSDDARFLFLPDGYAFSIPSPVLL